MNDREKAASAAGLKDLQLLRLVPDDMPIAEAVADLRQRFANHSAAFAPEVRHLSRADYKSARAEFLKSAEQADFQRRCEAADASAYRRHA